jgi:hypothetical protein
VSRVSYQLTGESPVAPAAFVALGASAIATRNRDVTTSLKIGVSKAQARWLKKAGSRGEVDDSQVVRALIDLGMELDIDWSQMTNGSDLRAAVRAAALVRRSG